MNIGSIQAFMQNHPGLFLTILIWTIIWKGLALWKAAGKQNKLWFIAILVLNTLGILDIIYYYFIDRDKTEETSTDSDGVEYIDDSYNN